MEIMKKIEKQIIGIVAIVSNVPVQKIIRNKRSTRHSNVVVSRQLLVNILFRNFNYTNHMVKDIIGYKNHASVVHARNMHETDYKYNDSYRKMYDRAMYMLGLYVSNKDEQASISLSMKDKIEEQEKQIDIYKDLWMNEKAEKERYMEVNDYYEKFIKHEGLLINFKKKYAPK